MYWHFLQQSPSEYLHHILFYLDIGQGGDVVKGKPGVTNPVDSKTFLSSRSDVHSSNANAGIFAHQNNHQTVRRLAVSKDYFEHGHNAFQRCFARVPKSLAHFLRRALMA